jgi:hypothetical protein
VNGHDVDETGKVFEVRRTITPKLRAAPRAPLSRARTPRSRSRGTLVARRALARRSRSNTTRRHAHGRADRACVQRHFSLWRSYSNADLLDEFAWVRHRLAEIAQGVEIVGDRIGRLRDDIFARIAEDEQAGEIWAHSAPAFLAALEDEGVDHE